MKKAIVFLTFWIAFLTTNAQLPTGVADYVFVTAYDSDGDEIELPGHPDKINISIVTTNFFGFSQSHCLYFEYDQFTGEVRGPITHDTYRGVRNGWHIYTWMSNQIFVKNDWSRVRVMLSFYEGNFCEYRKMEPDEDINDAATW